MLTISMCQARDPVGQATRVKVIASAGSEEKVKFMQKCGADIAFNYKATSIKDILAQHGPLNV